MSIGIVGRKVGMTRVFNEAGAMVPVTVLEVAANRVTQVKNSDKDGYRAVQVTTGARRPNRVSKAAAGHYGKAGVEPGRGLWEFRLEDGEGEELAPGAEIKADIFQSGQKVDVQGTTIGKGFAGVMKRHNFSGGRASHGNSINHRTPGSIGQCQTPGRVFKGKKMSGHMGNVIRTQQGLEVVSVDLKRNLLLIKGSVPGAKGSDVFIRPSVKGGAFVAPAPAAE
jgi:large subunit ribosomal protein L3